MLYCFGGTIYDIITFLICIIQKRKYLYNGKRHSKKENAILLYLEKPFKYAAIIFYFIGTLTQNVGSEKLLFTGLFIHFLADFR